MTEKTKEEQRKKKIVQRNGKVIKHYQHYGNVNHRYINPILDLKSLESLMLLLTEMIKVIISNL